MLSSDVKILNVIGLKVWRCQSRPTLNFMQLTPEVERIDKGTTNKFLEDDPRFCYLK